MQDMLVNLLQLPDNDPVFSQLEKNNIQIRRVLAPDKWRIVEWVENNTGKGGASECEVCFSRIPVSCFIATRGKEILGYACYNAIAPDFFGPTEVLAAERGKGIGKALLLRCLQALFDEGYKYAIIGGVGPADFYAACVGATLIPGSNPGIYEDYLGRMQ